MRITDAIRKSLRSAGSHRPTFPLLLAVGAMLGLLFGAVLLAPPASTPAAASGLGAATVLVSNDNNGGRVTKLELDRNDLSGPIPSSLGNATNLTAHPSNNASEVILRWNPGDNATVHKIVLKKGDSGNWEEWDSRPAGRTDRLR